MKLEFLIAVFEKKSSCAATIFVAVVNQPYTKKDNTLLHFFSKPTGFNILTIKNLQNNNKPSQNKGKPETRKINSKEWLRVVIPTVSGVPI